MACISFILCFVHYTLSHTPFRESQDEKYTAAVVYTVILTSECRNKHVRFDTIKNDLSIFQNCLSYIYHDSYDQFVFVEN